MIIEAFKEEDWHCLVLDNQASDVKKIGGIKELFGKLDAFPHTLKDNHRSLVKRGTLLGREVVAKQPRDKNRRFWPRVSSWVEAAEAKHTLITLGRFKELGIESVAPLLVLERRRLGQVIDSWVVYEYREGKPCNQDCLAEVIVFLQAMHKNGLRHNDPNFDNFLRGRDGTLFTIDCKGRKRRGTFTDARDFMLLKILNKHLLLDFKLGDISSLNRLAPGYWLAVIYTTLKAIRSIVKDAIKRNRPKNTDY